MPKAGKSNSIYSTLSELHNLSEFLKLINKCAFYWTNLFSDFIFGCRCLSILMIPYYSYFLSEIVSVPVLTILVKRPRVSTCYSNFKSVLFFQTFRTGQWKNQAPLVKNTFIILKYIRIPYIHQYILFEKKCKPQIPELASKLYLACFPNTNWEAENWFATKMLFHVCNFS